MNEEEIDPEHQTEDKMAAETDKATSLYIFHTNSLRLHDNPALLKAIVPGKLFRAVYIMDPFYYGNSISVNIRRFLLESMHDIDGRLRELSSRLYVVQGSFLATLDRLIQEWGVEQVAFEARIDCGGRLLDQATVQLCQEKGVEVVRCHSHTLYSPEDVQGNLDEASLTSMKAFMVRTCVCACVCLPLPLSKVCTSLCVCVCVCVYVCVHSPLSLPTNLALIHAVWSELNQGSVYILHCMYVHSMRLYILLVVLLLHTRAH